MNLDCVSARRFAPSKLGLAVSAVLLGNALPALASHLTPIDGSGGTPTLSKTGEVPIINIVKPNASGLSHNQYLDYNVDGHGVIINNSRADGLSLHSLPVPANPQFADEQRAASTILNEVIGTKRSRIEGRQEIFGEAADYVLSNPNGIYVNGGWIDTKRGTTTTLLVGKPIVSDDQLSELDSTQALYDRQNDQIAELKIDSNGLTVNGGGLQLITQRIDKQGYVDVAGKLDILAGRHRVDASTGALSGVDNTYVSLDAELLGAMSAERIRIVTTQTGAGIRMPITEVKAKEGIKIEATGNLYIGAEFGPADEQRLGQLYSEKGAIELSAGHQIELQALAIKADSLAADAKRDINLSALKKVSQSNQISQVANPWMIIPAGVTKTSEHSTREEILGVEVFTMDGIDLKAGNDINANAASLATAADVTLQAHNTLRLNALTQSTVNTITVDADRPFSDSQKRIERTDREAIRSHIGAGGKVQATATNIDIQGSRIRAPRLDIRAHENLTVQGVGVQSSMSNVQADRILFTPNKDLARDTTTTHYKDSELATTERLNLSAGNTLTLRGSHLEGGYGDVHLQAVQGIALEAGLASSTSVFKGTDWELRTFAEETRIAEDGRPGSLQWVTGFGVDRSKVIDTITREWAKGSLIRAENLTLDGGSAITAQGAVLMSSGDLDLSASLIELDASVDSQTFSNSRTGDTLGMQWTGGLDRAGSSAFAEHKVHTDGNNQKIHTGTSLVAAKNLSLVAESVTNVATQMVAAGDTLIKAGQVRNDAALDVVSTQVDHSKIKGSAGASVDYSDIARSVYKAVTHAEQARFHQQNLDDNLVPWSVGLDLTVDYRTHTTPTLIHSAKVTQIKGGNVTLDLGDGMLEDVGTHYEAIDGTTTIRAGGHSMKAAANTNTTGLNRLDIETLARLEAFTPVDFGGKLAAAGYRNDRTDLYSTAVVGKIQGKDGVQIQLGTDGLYEGTQFSSTGTGPFRQGGDISIAAGGNLSFEQATNSHEFIDYAGEGKGTFKLAFGETLGAGLAASGSGRYSTQQAHDTNAVVGSFNTPGHVSLHAGNALLLEGTQIGSNADRVAGVDASAQGTVRVTAAHDSKRLYGDLYTGGGNFKFAKDAANNLAVELGGSFYIGQTDETEHSRTGARWYSAGDMTVASQSTDGRAVEIEGLSAEARRIHLKAESGGIRVAAAQSTVERDNRQGGAGLGVGRVSADKPADDTGSIHARVKVVYDQLSSTTYANAQLKAHTLEIKTEGDLSLEGAVLTADAMTGEVGGNLLIKSLQDDVRGFKLDLDLRAEATHNPLAMLKGVKALGGPFAKKTAASGPFSNTVPDQWSEKIKGFDNAAAVRIDLEANKNERTTVVQQSALIGNHTWGLAVTGETHLVGANLGLPESTPGWDIPAERSETLTGTDYLLGGELHFASGGLDVLSQVWGALQKPDSEDKLLNLGLFRLDSRNETQTLVSSSAKTSVAVTPVAPDIAFIEI